MFVDSDNDPVLYVAIAAILLVLVVLACVYVLIIRPLQERGQSLQTYTGLYGNARRLGLQVCEVDGRCMFAAVADQLCVKCPYGNYSAESLKKRIHSSTVNVVSPQSVLSQLRQRFKHPVKQSEWQSDVDQLQTLADDIHRVIEIVHDDRRETTVLRPFDMQINESLMVLYIGRCCRGYYYSLRLKNKADAGKTIENECTISNNWGSVDEIKENNGANTGDNDADILSQNNSMIGDNNRQYIFNRSNLNPDGRVIQNNTVNGPGSTQNILVTFKESEQLRRFLHDTSRNFPEDERPNLHLKIRQNSDTLSCEQLEQEELTVIQSLNSEDSEARKDLDTVLDKFDLSFDKAIQGCILLQMSADSNFSFLHFVDEFNRKGLDELVEFIVSYILIDKDAATIELELSVDTKSEHPGEGIGHISDSNFTNQGGKQSTGRKTLSEGITILCKPKPRGQDNRSRSTVSYSDNTFSQAVTQTVINSACVSALIKSSYEENARFDRYALDPMVDYRYMAEGRQEIEQNNMNRLFESMHGILGTVTTHDGKKGTCFQVGNNYVLTAAHIIDSISLADVTCDMHVQFTSEDQKRAKLAYLCKELDFAIVCVYGFISRNKHQKYDSYPCYPGLSLDLIYPGKYKRSLPLIERAVVARHDYMFSKKEYNKFVMLEALGELQPGSSGCPGVRYQDGKLYIMAVLIGALQTSHSAYYMCTSMTDIMSHLKLTKPDLAKELMISPNFVLKNVSKG